MILLNIKTDKLKDRIMAWWLVVWVVFVMSCILFVIGGEDNYK